MPPRAQNPDRLAAIIKARNMMACQPVYLDTETTGLDGTDQIVEICILDHNGQVLVNSLIKPTDRIPDEVIDIHHISNEMVENAPTWPKVWEQVSMALDGRRVGIYNAEFDLRLMKQSHAKHGMNWNLPDDPFFCLMKLYAQFRGEWNPKYQDYRWHSLEAAAEQCQIPLPPRVHRAQEDTELARKLLEYMARATG